MDFQILQIEITTDPLGRGYAGMTDAQIVTSLNTRNRTRIRKIIPAYEIVSAIVPSEWAALTAAERERISFIVSAGNVDVMATNVRSAFTTAFAAGTTTRSNLMGLQNELISRAEELGLEPVTEGDIPKARNWS